MSELFQIRRPPGRTEGRNLSRDGVFITMQTVGCGTRGEATSSSDTTTVQLAVPPRISAP